MTWTVCLDLCFFIGERDKTNLGDDLSWLQHCIFANECEVKKFLCCLSVFDVLVAVF